MKTYCPGPLCGVAICVLLITGCGGAPQGVPPTSTSSPPTSTPVPPTPTPAPPVAAVPGILTSFQEAVNQQDIDGILNLFANTGPTFRETGLTNVHGKPMLRGYWEMQFGLHAAIRGLQDCTATEDTLRCKMVANDDCYVAYGLPESHSELDVKLKDGKIQQMTITFTAEDKKHYDDAFPKMMGWVEANMPEEWRILNRRGMSRSVGEAYSRACAAYAATLK